LNCGASNSPLLSALHVGRYARKETNLEHEIIEAVIDTNYRRLIDGRSIDISLGGIHNIVVGSDIDDTFKQSVSTKDLSAIVADGTGVKEYKGCKGELRSVIGITKEGRVEPLGCFINTSWPEIERMVKKRNSIDKWERYWKEKLGIGGCFDIEIRSIRLSACIHF
jgi:hypothetical protein